MAPTEQKKTAKNFTGKGGNFKKSKNAVQGVKKKRKWVPEHKTFHGSVKEGQGFALKRKEKVRHEYNKLLRKEKGRMRDPQPQQLYQEDYPEHLRHLYAAEAEKLRGEAWTNRVNRRKQRMKGRAEEAAEDDGDAQRPEAAEEEVTGGSEPTDPPLDDQGPSAASGKESLPISNRMRKRLQKQTSYQKTKEEFERIKEKRRKKKEEYLKNKQQREEAIQKYKQRKMETFQMLSKKTKKGQPNLNLQMEYLLQKIQKN